VWLQSLYIEDGNRPKAITKMLRDGGRISYVIYVISHYEPLSRSSSRAPACRMLESSARLLPSLASPEVPRPDRSGGSLVQTRGGLPPPPHPSPSSAIGGSKVPSFSACGPPPMSESLNTLSITREVSALVFPRILRTCSSEGPSSERYPPTLPGRMWTAPTCRSRILPESVGTEFLLLYLESLGQLGGRT